MVFYNPLEIAPFIANIEKGFTQSMAFELLIEEINPDDMAVDNFNHFKTMFSEENSFKLLFKSYQYDIPDNHVYTDDEIQQMLELQSVYGEDFINHLPL